KYFGGYGAPLDIRRAARAGVPIADTYQHSAECRHGGCGHAAQQLLAGIEAARNRCAGFWGMGCDCFAF
ncbi:MAG: amidohydrolase, partial [Verrucomicrobiales bacterium]|nr:amidohydrolase [Verrucomicrobiales bacterium]